MKVDYSIKAVFFDLDGTLLDTAPDLADACNHTLRQYNRHPVSYPEFRQWIHGGSLMMICNSFQIDADHPSFSEIKSAFLQNYQHRLTQRTTLFAGIDQVLSYLEQKHIPWGVITNKQKNLTEPLMSYFGFTQRCCCIISGDTLPTIKPHPAPLLHACALAKIEPQYGVYIGDTVGDILAAQAAGMRSIAVSYGYLPLNSNPVEWHANALVSTPHDILSTLVSWIEVNKEK